MPLEKTYRIPIFQEGSLRGKWPVSNPTPHQAKALNLWKKETGLWSSADLDSDLISDIEQSLGRGQLLNLSEICFL